MPERPPLNSHIFPLPPGQKAIRLREFLELHVWPTLPPEARRKWSRDEEDAILGYGETGETV